MKSADKDSEKSKRGVSAPQISLPKGGGAIKGIGEKFSSNPVTGTGSMNVPVPLTGGRSGFGPQLSISYDSGSGNGPFGFGWSLSLPSITRKTDKGLPRYQDEIDSDVFILSGAEDLVPVLLKNDDGIWKKDLNITVQSKDYDVQLYRPRIEGLFARIERWRHKNTGEVHWRSISKDNITTIYGKTSESRIEDPSDSSCTFSWLISESYDDKGNVIIYKYKEEDSLNVKTFQIHEKNRGQSRSANIYLKRIYYGNTEPYQPNKDLPSENRWLFEVVFDYGEHDQNKPTSAISQPNNWPVRQDPFSSYRSGFEVRTYRLCQRILMFHHFDELETDDYLVSSMDFEYQSSSVASFITRITKLGYVLQGNSYLKKSLPPLEFEYGEAKIQNEIGKIDAESLENLPIGLDGHQYQWVDLDGEGISGILTEQGDAWYYKSNLGRDEEGDPKFGPLQLLLEEPSLGDLKSGQMQFLDLASDGQLDLATFSGSTPGFYERTSDKHWEQFKSFNSLPNIEWNNPNLKFADLNGDGHADVLIAEDNIFTWYPSLAEAGFATEERVFQPHDEEAGPRILFSDGTQSIYLADLSGDGLSDIARIRNGEICYWPNLGYGRFGAKVTMDDSPVLDSPDLFDQKRVRLADIDGSGTTDIIYLGSDGIDVYMNQAGNSWSSKETLIDLPHIDDISSVIVADLFGNGTACLVWSSPLPHDQGQQMLYINLMGEEKPHLLISTKNNMGAETRVHYAPSTKFYLQDREEGKPWITRIPFPVHVVEKVETYDWISGNLFTTSYKYHHGYFDGLEREFRGFGMVEQLDTESFGVLSLDSSTFTNLDEAFYLPPVKTKTWFHSGAYFDSYNISKHFEDEYYQEPNPSGLTPDLEETRKGAMLLDDTVLPDKILFEDGKREDFILFIEEEREACRALKGSILRQEIYALDGNLREDMPYSVSERNYTIEVLQPLNENKHAVFFAHPRETIDYHYERELFNTPKGKLPDPRVTHSMNLAVDGYGNVLQSVAIGYGRRYPQSIDEKNKQGQILTTYTENKYTNPIKETDTHRTPLPCETKTFELLKITPTASLEDTTNLFKFDELIINVNSSLDIPYEDFKGTNATGKGPYRRMIEHVRTLYYNNDLSGPLKLGNIDSLGLPYESYKLAFTPELISQIYKRKNETQELNLLPDYIDILREGGYIQSNNYKTRNWFLNTDFDDYWWIPSGQTFYSPMSPKPVPPPEPLPQDPVYAKDHFYLPQGVRDPFGKITRIEYDVYDLILHKTEDALENTVMAKNDYRVLQPSIIIDPNDNRTAVKFDALGLVVGTAVMGKETEDVGDFLDDFDANLTLNDLKIFVADPNTNTKDLLKNATTRIVYDLDRFQRCGQPPFAATLARETHAKDSLPPEGLKIQISFIYSDGFGREIQSKIQAEPGNAPQRDPDIILPSNDHKPGKLIKLENDELKEEHTDHRWVGKGRTIYNNKGKPVKQYEPYFSSTHLYEEEPDLTMTGVTPILFYDPIERVVATLHPNHTYEKVVFDPWQQENWDVNDTLNPMQVFDPSSPDILPDHNFNPAQDPDVGSYFRGLKTEEYLPTWCNIRLDSSESSKQWPDPEIRKYEKSAAEKALKHSRTPTIAYLDNLGRVFLTVVDNGMIKDENGTVIEHHYETRLEIDIEGNQREVIDAKNRKVMIYDYDMLGNKIHQSSMEAGEHWMINDVRGNPIRSWDSRGHEFRIEYDDLHRPLRHYVKGIDPQETDNEILYEKVEYGEGEDGKGQIDDKKLNLRTRVFKQYDAAGVITNEEYDFKGNLLHSTRELAEDYTKHPNWPNEGKESINIESEGFTNSITYDALNRPVTMIIPAKPASNEPDKQINSKIHIIYNEANLLEQLNVNLRGETTATPFVTNINYNAKGQRDFIEYGNGAKTAYKYDDKTFRLIQMRTVNGNSSFSEPDEILNAEFRQPKPELLQDLFYHYDPAGNITAIRDNSQKTIVYNQEKVESVSEYVYDAIYRLIGAHGREHIGQASQPPSWNNQIKESVVNPNDVNAVRGYFELYQYDEVGNFIKMEHKVQNQQNPISSWIRTYKYKEESLIEPGMKNNESITPNNRLSYTEIGSNTEKYTYAGNDGLHGNMTSMPHLKDIKWDFKDQMQMVDKSSESKVYYVYDTAGQRVRKVEENGIFKKERIYLGGFEIYREYKNTSANPVLERETLHIMDDKQRIALVETKTIDKTNGNNGDKTIVGESLSRYQLNNHLGSTSLELDDFADIISYEEYYPYGSTSYHAVNKKIKAVAKRYRYTGKERDEETDLYYHGARYYVPWLGRWVSTDPIDIKDGTNLYNYVNNSPVNIIDPSGTRGLEPTEPNKSPNFGITIPFDISGKIEKPSININLTGILPTEPKRDPFENMLPLDVKGNFRFRKSVEVLNEPILHTSDLPKELRHLVDKVLPDGKIKLKNGSETTIKELIRLHKYDKPVEAEEGPGGYIMIGGAIGKTVIQKAGKAVINAGSGLIRGGIRTFRGSSSRLAKPGESLFVGTYKESLRANRAAGLVGKMTPHHGPANAVNKLYGIKTNEGITINISEKLLHPQTGSWHRLIDLTPNLRTQLAREVKDLKNILIKIGKIDWKDVNAALREFIRQNKQLWKSKGITGY